MYNELTNILAASYGCMSNLRESTKRSLRNETIHSYLIYSQGVPSGTHDAISAACLLLTRHTYGTHDAVGCLSAAHGAYLRDAC